MNLNALSSAHQIQRTGNRVVFIRRNIRVHTLFPGLSQYDFIQRNRDRWCQRHFCLVPRVAETDQFLLHIPDHLRRFPCSPVRASSGIDCCCAVKTVHRVIYTFRLRECRCSIIQIDHSFSPAYYSVFISVLFSVNMNPVIPCSSIFCR